MTNVRRKFREIIILKNSKIIFFSHLVSVKIKEITKCDGEASANNRKAKLIFFYEWVINGDWEGSRKYFFRLTLVHLLMN